jgi:hypothetical protein
MPAVGADISTAGSPVYGFVNMVMFACGRTPACPFPVAFPSVKAQEAKRYSSPLHIWCKTQQVTDTYKTCSGTRHKINIETYEAETSVTTPVVEKICGCR